jgi:UDP-N-acetylmuramoyl-L-alanyl-D-glutamate--2,6-diaminopimelate ligase
MGKTLDVVTRPEHPPRTRLSDLVAWLSSSGARVQLVGDPEVVVTGVSLSSQRVQPGDLYAALPGTRAHGIGYVGQALSAGAVAVLTDSVGAAKAGSDATVLIVDRPRDLLGRLAAWLYGEPATALRMIGVTGTQGKTTTVRLAEAALQAAGVRAASIGTVGTRVDGRDVPTTLTTPEAPDLHGLFAMMRETEVRACAMEVSSHALVMGRVDGVVFDVAVFLNLGRDHLDFHSDEEDYYRAKASLFTPERARLALIDVDDEHGRRLAGETRLPVRTLSLRDPAADWRADDVVAEATGSRFTAVGPGGLRVSSTVHLPGEFNVSNALAAVAACVEAGFDAEAVAAGLSQATGVPGRLEQIDEGQDFLVLVDYAHKPDAVAAALRTLRPLTEGRLIVVLGAGGDRDPGKRPIMAGIAAELADLLIVTDDNPRTEDPAAIRAEMLAGTRGAAGEVLEIGDRRAAIAEAVGRACSGDIVLIAGKGHETGQEIDGTVHPFDDRAIAREELDRL